MLFPHTTINNILWWDMPKRASVQKTAERIQNEFDPVGFMGRIQRGLPVELRALDGTVIGWDTPGLQERIICAKELLKLSHAPLAAAREDGTVPDVQIVFQTPVPLPPGAQTAPAIDVTPEEEDA